MPIPKPNKNENQNDFLKRCTPELYPEYKQNRKDKEVHVHFSFTT